MTRTIRRLMAIAVLGALSSAAPSEAMAQAAVFATFRADYTFTQPLAVGPHRVKFTLYDDGTFLNDDGNGGEWALSASNEVTLWFVNQAAAAVPTFGAATWRGQVSGGQVCSGTIRGAQPAPDTEVGTWKTRGCP